MAAQKKALTDEELFAQFEDIPSTTPTASSTSSVRTAKPGKPVTEIPPVEDDPLAELSALAAARPTSRPSTPRLSSSTTSGTTRRGETPISSGPPSGRTSEDRLRTAGGQARKSTESARSYHQGQVAAVKDDADTDQERQPQQQQRNAATGSPERGAAQPAASGGGGWWGSVFTAASAAVKQAEAAVKEIRGNEEAIRWAEQVKGNVETLKGIGGNVRSLAMPTFTTLLQTIAPPISAHERLQIHTTHDILSYPSMDPLIYSVFARVMSQVEGGDLLVIQRGSESRQRGRSTSDVGYRGGVLGGGSNAGWTDGPWWRDTASKRDLGAVKGLVEGSKLARASAEAYANDFFAARGGIEEAAKHATEVLSDSNPVRSSDIFLAIQAITQTTNPELFAEGQKKEAKVEGEGGVVEPQSEEEDLTSFAIYLHDPIHSLSFSAVSQSIPSKWVDWLDSSADANDGLPASIREMIESGGVDAREWVSEWMEEILSLAIGIVAQRYVAKRMGVGEGGMGRGKARARAEEGTAGEAARAI